MNSKQKALITGKLLGDGSLENRGTAHSRLQIRHSIKQKSYVDWCYEQLKNFTASAPKQHRQSYYFRTRSLPVFTNLRRKWYQNGKKFLPNDINLTPFTLAVWFMDDGYFDNYHQTIWLCVHCFTNKEIDYLQNQLSCFDIKSGKVKDRNNFKLRIYSRDTKGFINLVKPYILPSLLYKIGIAP